MILKNRTDFKSVRAAYGETLIELGTQNSNIVVLDADLSCSTQTQAFAKVFPERFFNIGIAEQDAMSTAAGLSTCGKIPFVSTFAIFATGRAYDQIRTSIAYPKFNVKIVATHGGITVGEDGATHQALEDISLMRGIPGMMVIIPADYVEVKETIKFAAKYNGPVYIRISRTSVPTIFDVNQYVFNPYKANIIKSGKDITVVSNGETLIEVLNCAEILEQRGINAEIISVPVVKPLDQNTIIESVKKTGCVVTVENHSIIGALGSAVCECLSENYPVPVKRIGVNDEFGQSGEQRQLMIKYGLTAETFVDRIEDLARKNSKKL